TFYELPEQESPASLWIHTHVREEALALYGFLTERERSMFLLLLGVAGIGPRVGLTVLSGMPPSELIEALRSQEARRARRRPPSPPTTSSPPSSTWVTGRPKPSARWTRPRGPEPRRSSASS